MAQQTKRVLKTFLFDQDLVEALRRGRESGLSESWLVRHAVRRELEERGLLASPRPPRATKGSKR